MNTLRSDLDSKTYPIVHLVRHGRIPDYQADQPLTSEGRQQSLGMGRDLAAQIRPGETVGLYSSPSRRARQTASLVLADLSERLPHQSIEATLVPIVAVDDRLLLCQFYMDGLSYDPMEPLTDAALWRFHQTSSPEYETCANYYREFWKSGDPMGYWLTHTSEVIESPEATLERICDYIAERIATGKGSDELRRDICVTHSGNLRVLLKLAFGVDPGDPPHCDMVTVSGSHVYYRGQIGNFPQQATG
jgi:broad specificity phosphatase PhoE